MDKMRIEIRVFSPQGEPIELTFDEAKMLYLELHKIFGSMGLGK